MVLELVVEGVGLTSVLWRFGSCRCLGIRVLGASCGTVSCFFSGGRPVYKMTAQRLRYEVSMTLTVPSYDGGDPVARSPGKVDLRG